MGSCRASSSQRCASRWYTNVQKRPRTTRSWVSPGARAPAHACARPRAGGRCLRTRSAASRAAPGRPLRRNPRCFAIQTKAELLRIAVVASPVTPLRPAQLGGAQAFVCDLALGLARRGHQVTLHCAEGSELEGVRLLTVPAPSDAAAALVMPGGAEPAPTPGVDAAIEAMFDSIRKLDVDAISQHAFDA